MSQEPPFPPPQRLLDWYDRHRRVLPWRALPGEMPDPYRVWLSEVMLQQTTVAAVEPYFLDFTRRWPTIADLAAAELDEILAAWAGLGYYARARNLHRAARILAERESFPDTEAGWAEIPGVGAYTAAAVAAIAFDRQAVVMDGNVERVMARLFAVTEPLPGAKPALKARAAELTPADRPGDYAQAVMDLGATLCSPRSPACVLCPWSEHCLARKAGIAADLPARAPKAARPRRHGLAFWVRRPGGDILLRRRPERGLLGGMMEIPSTPWRDVPWSLEEALAHAPARADWKPLPGLVRHVFTHFELELTLVAGLAVKPELATGWWCPLDRLDEQALPSVMRKLVRHALAKAIF